MAETSSSLTDQSRSGEVVQILTVDGYSSRSARSTPKSPQRPPVGEYTSIELNLDSLDAGGGWKVVSTALNAEGATYAVQVAVPIRVQRETVQTVAIFLLPPQLRLQGCWRRPASELATGMPYSFLYVRSGGLS